MKKSIIFTAVLLSAVGCKKSVSGTESSVSKAGQNSEDLTAQKSPEQKISELEKKSNELDKAISDKNIVRSDQLMAELKKMKEELIQQQKELDEKNRKQLIEFDKKLAETEGRFVAMLNVVVQEINDEIIERFESLRRKQTKTTETLNLLTEKIATFDKIYATKEELKQAVISVQSEIVASERYLIDLINQSEEKLIGYTNAQILQSQVAFLGSLTNLQNQINSSNQSMIQLEQRLKGDLATQKNEINASISSVLGTISNLNTNFNNLLVDYNQKISQINSKLDLAYNKAEAALDKISKIESDGKDLVNEVGSLISTIEESVDPITGQVVPSQEVTGAKVLNLLLSGFTKEAAGLIVFSQKLEDALKTRYNELLSLYTNMSAKVLLLESKLQESNIQQDSELLLAKNTIANLSLELANTQIKLAAVEKDGVEFQEDLTLNVQSLTEMILTLESKILNYQQSSNSSQQQNQTPVTDESTNVVP